MREKLYWIFILLAILICVFVMCTGCSDAETVSYNISKEADMFKVKRRITFINLRSNEFLFTITGNCSVQDGESNELDVICKIGDDKYQKHMLKNAKETTYVIEQLEYSDVSKYDYEIIFRPEAIVPIQIKTEVGDN
jgi:hypothetical protein